MHFKSGVTMLLVAGLLAGGCGGGDDEKGSAAAAKPDTAQATRADAAAKMSARTAVTEMEACYVDAESYADCKPATAGVEVSEATDATYILTAASDSGNAFAATKADSGALTRTCTTKGEGGCSASGTW